MVGSQNSSNSNRLREIADRYNIPAYLVDNAAQLQREWFDGKNTIGITAGASAPEVLVNNIIQKLKDWGADTEQELDGIQETVVFQLPKALSP